MSKNHHHDRPYGDDELQKISNFNHLNVGDEWPFGEYDFSTDIYPTTVDPNVIDPRLLSNETIYPDPNEFSSTSPYPLDMPLTQQPQYTQHLQNPTSGTCMPQHESMPSSPAFQQVIEAPVTRSHNQFLNRQISPRREINTNLGRGITPPKIELSCRQLPAATIPSHEDYKYQNHILNQFEDASIALRIIDEVLGEFDDATILRLNKAANAASKAAATAPNRLRTRKMTAIEYNGPSPLTSRPGNLPSFSSADHGVSNIKISGVLRHSYQTDRFGDLRLNHVPMSQQTANDKSKRTKRMEETTERLATLYDTRSPDQVPTPWFGDSGTLFKYSKDGELNPKERYSVDQIGEFLQCHPLNRPHMEYGRPTYKDSYLTLWLQRVPADSASRYPSQKHGAQCRYAQCPTKSLRTGEFRVTFSEDWLYESDPVFKYDPFHNAGYMHLYCLEKMFNIVDIANRFNFRPDLRTFTNDKADKMMALHRDGEGILKVLDDYLQRDEQQVDEYTKLITATDSSAWFMHSLTRALTVWHVTEGKKNTQKQAEARRGFDISKHLGDLELQEERTRLKKENKKREKARTQKSPAGRRGKRKQDLDIESEEEDDISDEEEDDEADEGKEVQSISKRRRSTKAMTYSTPTQRSRNFNNSADVDHAENRSPGRNLRSTAREYVFPSTLQKTTPHIFSQHLSMPPESLSSTRRRSVRNGGNMIIDSDTIVVDAPQRSPTRTSPRLARRREQEAQSGNSELDRFFDDGFVEGDASFDFGDDTFAF